MSSDWSRTPLPGVLVRQIPVHQDGRGSFSEVWRASWFHELPRAAASMRQANLSRSGPRVLRGLHVHERQADLWVIAEGTAFVGLVDIRPVLSGMGAARVHTLEAAPGTAIYLPDGVAHGFYARHGLTMVYLVTNEYDGSDELGFAYDDPAVGVPWPDADPVVSERDRSAGTLAQLVERIRSEGRTDA